MDLLASISDLHSGRWTVVIYKPGCIKCSEILPVLIDLAQESKSVSGKWCLVNIGDSERGKREVALLLPSEVKHVDYRSVTITTPMIFTVEDNKITALRMDGE